MNDNDIIGVDEHDNEHDENNNSDFNIDFDFNKNIDLTSNKEEFVAGFILLKFQYILIILLQILVVLIM